MSETAVELLKAYGINPLPGMPPLAKLVSSWIRDKEFNPEVVVRLTRAGTFGRIVANYLMGTIEVDADESRAVVNNIGRHVASRKSEDYRTRGLDRYHGTRDDNFRIDHALSEAGRKQVKFGQATSNRFILSSLALPPDVLETRIAIIGYGAAGILMERTLRSVGFTNIAVFEKSNNLGIWSNRDVFSRSRNNPVNLTWNETSISAAPGDGQSVREFLRLLSYDSTGRKAVLTVTPKHLKHTIHFAGANHPSIDFPIVINCSGLGSPRHPSHDDKMTTNVNLTTAGNRWQRVLDVDDVRGKSFVFIGLGNSTAEMLRQIHDFQDSGIEVDYRIMTHYPKDSVFNPEDVIEDGDTQYRIFRDISIPNLTSWQGDLSHSRYDYFRALRTGKIIPNVRHWERNGDRITCLTRDTYGRKHFKADHLYTLIGYNHTPSYLISQGMLIDPGDSCPKLDYDGEVQSGSVTKNNRLWHGYFAFGAMAANPRDKNSVVIPGMLFRLYDLIPSIVIRAAESVLPEFS